MMVKKVLDESKLNLDLHGLRRGHYADPPYLNIVSLLTALTNSGYRLTEAPFLRTEEALGNMSFDLGESVVEAHWIVRRQPFTVVAGLPVVLAILRECTGYFDNAGKFINTAESLDVEVLNDGELIAYDGNPADALPVMTVRGKYKDFALLKTPILGILSRTSRVATNVYRILQAAGGKPVYTFCARYDPPEVQVYDGYAYHIAVRRFNKENRIALPDAVSTYANAEWWGGDIEGTISHEAIACFLGNPAELMLRFAESLPVDRIRVALVDFHNDCIADTRMVMRVLFERYMSYVNDGEIEQALRYKLHGVRVDTSKELVDKSLEQDCQPSDHGASPRLLRLLREAIDHEWLNWELPTSWQTRAEQWCREIKIMVSGGVTEERIAAFERDKVPVDCYGVGSALLSNHVGTTTDFSSIVMRIKIENTWYDIAKVGRRANHNSLLRKINLKPASPAMT